MTRNHRSAPLYEIKVFIKLVKQTAYLRSVPALFTNSPFAGVFPDRLGTELGDNHLDSFAR